MTEIAVYGLPVRMPHWSFGARYIYQLLQRHMGYSRLFEVVFPGDPGHAYLAASNGLADNVLVTAHVLGHADFSKNNMLFRRCQDQGNAHIIEHAAAHARQIERDIEAHGFKAVEQVLDAALSLEQYVDLDQPLRRERYPEYAPAEAERRDDAFRARFATLDAGAGTAPQARKPRAPLPPHPERDLLWFIATYAPEMESWERDIFLAVREESFYFYPVFATQIMNEGWASYWHARLLREADFIPEDDLSRRHQMPFGRRASGRDRGAGGALHQSLPSGIHALGGDHQAVRRRGGAADHARGRRLQLLAQSPDARDRHGDGVVPLSAAAERPIKVVAADVDELHESLLLDKYNFGAPRVAVTEVRNDGTLVLEHDASSTAAGSMRSARSRCSSTSSACGAGRCCSRRVDAPAKAVEFSSESAAA